MAVQKAKHLKRVGSHSVNLTPNPNPYANPAAPVQGAVVKVPVRTRIFGVPKIVQRRNAAIGEARAAVENAIAEWASAEISGAERAELRVQMH